MYPVFLRLGPPDAPTLLITSYGVMACLGFVLAYLLCARRCRQLGWDPEIPVDIFLICVTGGIVFARAYFVMTYPERFLADPAAVVRLWEGGLTFYGSLIGTLVCGTAYLWYWRLPWGAVADAFVPQLVIGHALGRVGCFLHGCCYGSVTTGAWGFTFPLDPTHMTRHPTQLYEAGAELFNFAVLEVLWRRGWRNGRLTCLWLGAYGAQRFVLEYWRGDTVTERYLFGTTAGQTTALGFMLAAAIGWRFVRDYSEEEMAPLFPDDEDDDEAEA